MDTKTQQAVDIVNQRITNMVLKHPFFSTIVLNLDVRPMPGVGTACTDGTNLLYEPEFILGLSKEQVSGLIAHEAMHVALMHPYRMDRSYHEPRKSNVAMDFEINNFLDSYNKAMNQNGDVPFPLPSGGLIDHQYDGMAWEQIYEKLPKDDGGDGGQGQPGEGDGNDAGQWGKVTTPDDSPGKDGDKGKEGQSKPGKTRSDWEVIVAKAEQIAKMHGKMPGDFETLINGTRRPEIPWAEYLRRFFESHAQDDFDTRRSDRRYLPQDMYLPSLYSDAMGPLVIADDCSGSMYDEELHRRMFAEMDDILSRVRPESTTLLQFDTRIVDVREYRPGETVERKMTGGGGTSFIPIFDWIGKEGNQTKVLVMFTDGYGDWPSRRPDYTVLAVDYGGGDYYPEWVEVIRTKP